LKSIADFSYLHSTTTTEASEVQARLLELSTGILQSSHAHSVLPQDLISHQDVVLNRHDDQAQYLEGVCNRGTLGGTNSSTVSTCLSSAVSCSPGCIDTSDNTSITSRRSTPAFRLGRPAYIEDLKESRAYKRLRHFGRGIDYDSSAESVFSFGSDCTGNWSMLSDLTLEDLSVSQIAVLNLPIDLAHVSNPEPFKEPSSTATHRRHKRCKWSSRGRIHNAIENGNGFVVRALLSIGVDIEELDSKGRTPLIHATVKGQESICKLLLEKNASVGALKGFTSCMDISERSELLDPLINKAIGDGSKAVTVLKLLLLMALGTNYGDDNWSSSRSMMGIAIDMGYELAVCAIIHLDPQVLVGVDTDGRTPFAYAYHLRRNEICETLLHSAGLDSIQTTTEVVKSEGDFGGRVHAAVEGKFPHLLWFLLGTVEKIGIKGKTPLARATQAVSEDINYESWNYFCEGEESKANTETVEKNRPNSEAHRCIATSMQELIEELVEKDNWSILVLLSLIEARDAEGWTPLASAAFTCNEALCDFLVAKGCNLCLDAEQKEQLNPELSLRIHDAARCSYMTSLPLLLDMGADINERDSYGETALLEAVSNNHLSCVKVLIERGADTTISTTQGESVLHRAAWRSIGGDMMEFLLEYGVGTRGLVNMEDTNGDTPLHDCSRNSHITLEHAEALLQAGASLTIKNKAGETPYRCARDQRRKELTKYLWSQLSPEQQAQEEPLPFGW